MVAKKTSKLIENEETLAEIKESKRKILKLVQESSNRVDEIAKELGIESDNLDEIVDGILDQEITDLYVPVPESMPPLEPVKYSVRVQRNILRKLLEEMENQ